MVSMTRQESERSRVGSILADRRKAERLIPIYPCKNPPRRAACLADSLLFLKTYFPDKYPNPWTEIQKSMVAAVDFRVDHGGDQAHAGPRGCAKTTCTEGSVTVGIFRGRLKFPLVLAPTGPDATRILDNIKFAIETSDALADDFPEVVTPIRALEGAPQRGNMQMCRLVDWDGKPLIPDDEGERSMIEWSADRVIFPTVRGSLCAGAILMARGIDGSVRGLNVFSRRPDFVLLDDIDTTESAASDHLTAKRERAIERDVAGLAGPGKSIARVMLCTPQNRRCLAYKYTDPKQKPSWNGKRYQLLTEWPKNRAIWEEDYASQRMADQQAGDALAAGATALYEARRAEMDEGAIVSDPLRFVHGEVSAVQHCFNIISDRGIDAFLTEYQCDPPEEEGPQESGITAALVASRVNQYPHLIVPPNCIWARGVDVGDHRLHWANVAANRDAASFVFDYGFEEVYGTSPEDMDADLLKAAQDDPRRRMAVEQAIYKTLVNMREWMVQNPYMTEMPDGELIAVEPSLVLIDSGSGLHQRPVYQFCRDFGKPFVPAKGFGQGRGVFRVGNDKPGERKSGENWAQVKQNSTESRGTWLYEFDADYWKRQVHQRFLTPTLDDAGNYRRGSLSLWKPSTSHRHSKYGRGIESEIWTQLFVQGKGTKEFWDRRHKDNHPLDATAMACVGLSMAGVRVIGERTKRTVKSMADMQAQARKA